MFICGGVYSCPRHSKRIHSWGPPLELLERLNPADRGIFSSEAEK